MARKYRVASIEVYGEDIRPTSQSVLTSNTVGSYITVNFDDVWAGLDITTIFLNNGKKVERKVSSLDIEIPVEAINKDYTSLYVGFKGSDIDGTMILRTKMLCLGKIPYGTTTTLEDLGYPPIPDEKLPTYNELVGMIGNLSDLDTIAKNNLVAAINECHSLAGQGGDGGSVSVISTILTAQELSSGKYELIHYAGSTTLINGQLVLVIMNSGNTSSNVTFIYKEKTYTLVKSPTNHDIPNIGVGEVIQALVFDSNMILLTGGNNNLKDYATKNELNEVKELAENSIASITRIDIVESKNLMPPDQEQGLWKGSAGQIPIKNPGDPTNRRTVSPFSIESIKPDTSKKRQIWVSVNGSTSGKFASLLFLDNQGKLVVQANAMSFPKQIYVDPKAVSCHLWSNNIDLKDLCIAATPGYEKYVQKGKHVYVKSESIDPLYVSDALREKLIVNFGDSIFGCRQAPDDISTAIALSTGATVINAGFSGTKMAEHTTIDSYSQFSMVRLSAAIATGDWSSQQQAVSSGEVPSDFQNTLNKLKNIKWKDVHCITIALGTNDFDSTVPIDTPNVPKNHKSFTGALRSSIENIESAYPNINIFICSQTYRAWLGEDGSFIDDSDTHIRRDLRLIDFIDKTKAIADEYHLPYIDNYNIGINKYNRSKVFTGTDNTHFNTIGCYMIGGHMARILF